MAFIKNDVTDEELDKLFNNNDNSSFVKKDEVQKEETDDDLISPELDAKNNELQTRIERPVEYKKDEVHAEKLKERKKEEALLKSADGSNLKDLTGQVSSKVFSEIAKVRQQAQLEAYKQSQAKIPKISPNAKFKLYGDQECKYHVYIPYQMVDNNTMITTCKFCSAHKIFTMKQWLHYQLENSKYM